MIYLKNVNFGKKISQKVCKYKKSIYLCATNVGFSHLLINLTNLTSGVRKFPRLSNTIFFVIV